MASESCKRSVEMNTGKRILYVVRTFFKIGLHLIR